MKLKISKFKLFISLAIISLMFSCKKYDEGGRLNRAEKSIVGNWKLASYQRNEEPPTQQILNWPTTGFYDDANFFYSLSFKDNGEITMNYRFLDYDIGRYRKINFKGNWELDSCKKLLVIIGENPYPQFKWCRESYPQTNNFYASIKRLDKQEIIYSFRTLDGILHRFQFVRE